jgi:hypothetical protein
MTPASGPTVAARRASVTRLRAHGQTITEIADELGCSFATVARDLKALGLPALERKRRGAIRACEQCRKERYCAPSQLDWRFCEKCWREHLTRHPPPPTDRTCRHCDKVLTFEHPKDAVGRGYYCNRECYDGDRPERVAITCPECHTVHLRPPSQAHKHLCPECGPKRENMLRRLAKAQLAQGRSTSMFGRYAHVFAAAKGKKVGRRLRQEQIQSVTRKAAEARELRPDLSDDELVDLLIVYFRGREALKYDDGRLRPRRDPKYQAARRWVERRLAGVDINPPSA